MLPLYYIQDKNQIPIPLPVIQELHQMTSVLFRPHLWLKTHYIFAPVTYNFSPMPRMCQVLLKLQDFIHKETGALGKII
jgi:hypothetical protein